MSAAAAEQAAAVWHFGDLRAVRLPALALPAYSLRLARSAEEHPSAVVAGEPRWLVAASAASPAEESAPTNPDHECSMSCDGIPRVTSVREWFER